MQVDQQGTAIAENCYGLPAPPVFCNLCQCDHPPSVWRWERSPRYRAGGRYRCRIYKRVDDNNYIRKIKKDPIRLTKYLNKRRSTAKDHACYRRYKTYRHGDSVKRCERPTLSWDVAALLMAANCFYCGTLNAGGLDRLDCSFGHSEENVVSCCAKCNYMLGDLPYEVKLEMRETLRRIAELRLLDDWISPNQRPKGELMRITSTTQEQD